jgi:TM2 domain-containing membrane protein YozV
VQGYGGYGPPPPPGPPGQPPGPGGQPPGGFRQFAGAPAPGQFAPPAAYGAYGYHAYNNQAPFGIEPTSGLPYSDKQKVLAGVLQIFLGKFGIGRFYTGHTQLAIAQLITCMLGVFIFSWFTCGLSAFVLLWPVIDGIMLLTSDSKDAQGRPLR